MNNTKIAVLALVLVVAVPILVGYGTAFQDVEKDGWDAGETTNITEPMNNSIEWVYVVANSYDANSRVITDLNDNRMFPLYEKVSASPQTSIRLSQTELSAGSTFTLSSTDIGTLYFVFEDEDNDDFPDYDYQKIRISYRDGDVITNTTLNDVLSMSFDNGRVFGYQEIDYALTPYSYSDVISIIPDWDDVIIQSYSSTSFADPSQGWRIDQPLLESMGPALTWSMPDLKSDYLLLTIDFAGLKAVNEYTTVGGSVRPIGNVNVSALEWSVSTDSLTINGTPVPAFFGSDGALDGHNVWQLQMTLDGYTMNYIKTWPSAYGPAPSYYTLEVPYSQTLSEINSVSLPDGCRFRMDTVNYRSYSYPVIRDLDWDPQTLLKDPAASFRYTFSRTDISGASIGWGGQTYDVTNGAITVGRNTIKLADLRLDSVWLNGERTNMINGQTVGTGDTELVLSGMWSASIEQAPLEHKTWTESEWQAGEWAFNGIGSDFAIVGLLTCGAVFVGLGMYGRRSGAKVGMLMLITGCAAFIFLAMI